MLKNEKGFFNKNSTFKNIEIFQKKDKITYFFQNKEPIVKSFSVYTDFEQKKKNFLLK